MRSFRGHLAGDPSHHVTLTVSPTFVGGTVFDGHRELTIEPLALRTKGADVAQTIVYATEDALAGEVPPPPCGASSLDRGDRSTGAPGHDSLLDAPSIRGSCWKLEVRAQGDYEYYANEAGKDYNVAFFAIAVAINEGSARFSPINLDLVVPNGGLVILTDPNHSLYYPKSSNGAVLLDSTRDFWNFFLGGYNRDAVLLFTGKAITYAGTPIGGLAYTDVLCNAPKSAYGLVKWYKNSYTYGTVAHELGHMLGAHHTDEVACPAGTGGGLMLGKTSPALGAQFSKCSIDEMNWHIWFNHGCMTQGSCV